MLMGYETDNPLHGLTRNPWNVAQTPGGSSGGEAVAIATGASAGGIGSDGGGSIRVPAHFSGICGFKPTPGRIPATGHQPACLGPFSLIGVVGPMARTVADVRLFDRVLSGHDVDDPLSVPIEETRQKPKGKRQNEIRVAYFEDDGVVPVTAETRAAVRRAARAAADAGFAVEEYSPPALGDAAPVWEVFFAEVALLALHEELGGAERELPILRSYLDRQPIYDSVSSVASLPPVAEIPLSSARLIEAWVARDRLRAEFQAQLGPQRVLLCPAAAMPAFGHGERSWSVEGRSVGYLESMRYTQWFNILGAPAVVVPVGQSSDGLPIGVQAAGRPHDDELVLEVASVIERESGGYRPPPGFDGV
jgi:amidase